MDRQWPATIIFLLFYCYLYDTRTVSPLLTCRSSLVRELNLLFSVYNRSEVCEKVYSGTIYKHRFRPFYTTVLIHYVFLE